MSEYPKLHFCQKCYEHATAKDVREFDHGCDRRCRAGDCFKRCECGDHE